MSDLTGYYLKVIDGMYNEDPVMGTYCGTAEISDIVSSYNSISVKFVTDESDQHSGFQLHFEAIESLY